MINLRPYQEQAIQASIDSSLQRQMVVMATGCGKTVTAIALAKRYNRRVLWLTHTTELVSQTKKSFDSVWPEARAGIVKAEKNQYMRDAVIATVQTAQGEARLQRLAEQNFGLVIIDEAHHAPSASYRKIVERLGCFAPCGPRLIGLTATPERSDNAALSDIFEGVVFHLGIESAIDLGCLVKPSIVKRPIQVDLDSITVARGDYSMRELDVALMRAGIVEEIGAAYEEHAIGRKSLIFVVSVEQAEHVASYLRSRGHAVEAVSGQMDPAKRRDFLRQLKNGELSAVVNCQILTEGFDEPSVDCVILARPTQSKPLMIQICGRGLRLFPGKTDCLIVDLVGASKRNTLIQAAVLFGIEKPEIERRDTEITPQSDPEEYWRRRLLSQIEGLGGAPRSKLRWLAGESGEWLLPGGDFGTVRMIPSGDLYAVDVVGIRIASPSNQTLSSEVDLDTAQAIAEDYVRRCDAVGLAKSSASWRDAPVTDGQAKMLKRFGIKTITGLTKGTASDLITQKMASQAAEPATEKQVAYLSRMGFETQGISKNDARRMIAKCRVG